MFKVKQYKLEMFGICMAIVLAGVVIAQEAQPYQYTPPYQNAFANDRRRYNVPYDGYNGYDANYGDTVRFPDDGMSPVSLIHGISDDKFNERHKKDNRYGDESRQRNSNEVSALMQPF